MKKFLFAIFLCVFSTCSFAGWENWHSHYHKDINACSLGIAHRESKESLADASVIVMNIDEQAYLQIGSDGWMNDSDNITMDFLISSSQNRTVRETFNAVEGNKYLLDITKMIAIFLGTLTDDEYLKFKPADVGNAPVLTVPLKSKGSRKAVKDFLECARSKATKR